MSRMKTMFFEILLMCVTALIGLVLLPCDWVWACTSDLKQTKHYPSKANCILPDKGQQHILTHDMFSNNQYIPAIHCNDGLHDDLDQTTTYQDPRTP